MSMKSEQEKILGRIRKLLAMAADTSSPNEAAIAAKRAESLMRKHQLSQVDVLVKNLDGDSVEISTVDHVQTIYGPKHRSTGMPKWVGFIAVAAAVMNECEADREHGLTRFYGVAGDAQVAAEIFQYLLKEAFRLSRNFPGGRAEKNSFRLGCASELQRRAKELRKEREKQFQETSAGTALVVLKKQLIEKGTGRKFNYNRNQSSVNGNAYEAGREAGSRINMSGQIGRDQINQRKLRSR